MDSHEIDTIVQWAEDNRNMIPGASRAIMKLADEVRRLQAKETAQHGEAFAADQKVWLDEEDKVLFQMESVNLNVIRFELGRIPYLAVTRESIPKGLVNRLVERGVLEERRLMSEVLYVLPSRNPREPAPDFPAVK